ncbi:MAG: UDP-forming cellulose synthase catalytic subunit [Parvibaculaceae bacterium]|nr:UDP-forming cellulose synthase catalytic subunit [Parvibaculaceae bacterium]
MNQNTFLARFGRLVAFAAAGFVFYFAIITPLDLKSQIIFGVASIIAAFIISRSSARQLTIALAILSLVMSTRYIYWRTTETLHFQSFPGAFFGTGLYLAEVYAWLVLVFGYFQTMWPLERPVRPLTGDPEYWPTVDVFVPTYNESLTLVSSTVMAALKMDYPAGRFRVHLLDDGRREEFREFAEAVGANYIIRPDNLHAKAGNLNHALMVSDAELICIFDCDHVPTRAFLQLTVGWFLEDDKLALLQTPHYFYSPDPFQRNLETGDDLPGEGELFYSSVQSGNDLWNATFFCGSCALMRRSALEENGGFAVETVTEDAHTALEMQKRGWNTAYLNIRLSAGLATERLSLHISQRIRWARGMTQILRMDNPLWGGKLSVAQRLCYLNAMLHFQFALPRVVFLTSPLAYLLFGQNIISATALTILAYAGPHLVHAAIANARIQGKYRPTFWGEVYEAVLAFYLVWPTLVTLFDPKRGKFNVTDKGGLLTEDYFDLHLMRPHLIAAALLVAGIIFGLSKMIWPDTFQISLDTLLLNVGWAVFNLLILLTAIAVARETKQVRMQVRVRAELPATLYFADGHTVSGTTQNLSMGGVSVMVPESFSLTGRELTDIDLPSGAVTAVYPAEVVSGSNAGLRLRFREMSLEARANLVRTVMGRADAWVSGTELELEPEPVLDSFTGLLKSSSNVFKATIGKGKMRLQPAESFNSNPDQLGWWARLKIMRSRFFPERVIGGVRAVFLLGVIIGGLTIVAGRVFAADFDPAAAFSGGPGGAAPNVGAAAPQSDPP